MGLADAKIRVELELTDSLAPDFGQASQRAAQMFQQAQQAGGPYQPSGFGARPRNLPGGVVGYQPFVHMSATVSSPINATPIPPPPPQIPGASPRNVRATPSDPWYASRAMKQFGSGITYAAGHAAAAYFNAERAQAMTGRADVLGEATAMGTLIGGVLGAGIGAFAGGPFGAIIGAHAGSAAGGALWERLAVPDLVKQQSIGQMVSMATLMGEGFGRVGYSGGQMFDPGRGGPSRAAVLGPMERRLGVIGFNKGTAPDDGPGWFGLRGLLSNSTGMVSAMGSLWAARGLGQMAPGQEELTQTWGILSSAMIRGGIDPLGGTGAYWTAAGPGFAPVRPRSAFEGNAPHIVGSLRDVAGDATESAIAFGGYRHPERPGPGGSAQRWTDYGRARRRYEELAATSVSGPMEKALLWTYRLAERYGKLSPEEAKAVAPVISTLPETGATTGDIVNEYGVEGYLRYRYLDRSPDEEGLSGEDWIKTHGTEYRGLMRSNIGVRAAGRRARLGSLQIRGKGLAETKAYGEEMGFQAELGTDTVGYAESRQKMLGAMWQSFDEADTMSFGLPMTRLEGLRARSQYLPFAPGYTFGIALSAMGMRSQQIKRIQTRRAGLKAVGGLSEGDELRLAQQEEGLQTANAADIGMISEGMESRLPALSANTPASFRRFDSPTLAAYNLAAGGVPMRRFGAVSGGQARAQDAFVSAASGSPMNPTSPSGIDNPELVSALKELTNVLKRAVGSAPARQSPGGQPTVPAKDLGW